MTDVHHHGGTVIEDRQGPATALAVLAVVALIGFLVWLFAFSGVVFDRNGGTDGNNRGDTTVNLEQQPQQPQQQAPPAEQPPAT